MTVSYRKAGEDLRDNPEQWSAYESTGSCVILAGPGSGKTKTITIKVARMLAEDVQAPQRIACITYSNACVGELRTRLSRLTPDDDRRLLVSTVHSFCLTDIVLPYAKLAGLAVPDPFVMATPAQSRQLFGEAYQRVRGGPPPNWFRTQFDRLRRTIPDRQGPEWADAPAQDTAVIEAYEALLLNNGLIDFDGLVLAGLRLVESNLWVRRAICAKFPIIVIDEYQDLGLPLHRMVLSLLKVGVRVLAVGDPDQSIYGFTGAKPELLRALSTHASMQAVTLRLNYRCGDRIISASNTLLPSASDYRSHDGRGGEIKIHETLQALAGQARYALTKVVPALLKANPTWRPGDIAFLYRTMNEGTAIAKVADDLKIKYFRMDNGAPVKRSRLMEWLTQAARWCAGGWHSGDVQLSQLLKTWMRLQRSVSNGPALLESRQRLVSALFSLRDGAMPMQGWLIALRDAVLDQLLREEADLVDEIENLTDLQTAVGREGKLEGCTVEVFGSQGKSSDQINLITLHSSKGLEFQAVLMLGLEHGEFPSRYAKTQDEIDEAKRLFYVGVTRAKSHVHLMYDSNASALVTGIRAVASN